MIAGPITREKSELHSLEVKINVKKINLFFSRYGAKFVTDRQIYNSVDPGPPLFFALDPTLFILWKGKWVCKMAS